VQGAAACVTAKACPPTEMVAVRTVVFGLAAALKLMVVLPLPLGVLVTLNQPALLVAVHWQPLDVPNANDPVDAEEPIDWLPGLSV
jgi:hypothetical protein